MARSGISQCMIVKDEEDNIERALNWGKGVVAEQIVVDTGSTDRTVEIARSMGAKVYEFPWADDFAAAKNYAIKQASCDWIAFLDADEYFKHDDAVKLADFLKKLTKAYGKIPAMVETQLVNLGNEGKANLVAPKARVFSRYGGIRYTGRVHEYLIADEGVEVYNFSITDMNLYHTGYTDQAFEEKKKTERNRRILMTAVEEEPDNPWNYNYLGDCCLAEGEYREAVDYYRKALDLYYNSEEYRDKAMCKFLLSPCCYEGIMESMFHLGETNKPEYTEAYESGSAENPDFPDFDMWRGRSADQQEDWESTVYYLEQAIGKSQAYEGQAPSSVTPQMSAMAVNIVKAARYLGDTDRILKYSIMGLQMIHYHEDLLVSLMITLLRGTPRDAEKTTVGFLSKLYDFKNIKDLLFLYKCAKLTGNKIFEELLCQEFTQEERIELEANHREKLTPKFEIRNQVDDRFLNIMEVFHNLSKEELTSTIEENAGEKVKGLAVQRVELVKGSDEWLMDFYDRLSDYRSKDTLYALLADWYYGDESDLRRVMDNLASMYFDTDIVSDGKDTVYVDIQAGQGEFAQKFAQCYKNYDQMLCYEAREDYRNQMKYSLYSLRDSTILFGSVETDEDVAELASSIPAGCTFFRVDAPGREEIFLRNLTGDVWKAYPVMTVRLGRFEDVKGVVEAIDEMSGSDVRESYYLRYYGKLDGAALCILYSLPNKIEA